MRHTQVTAIVTSVTQEKYITTALGTFFCVTDVRQNIVHVKMQALNAWSMVLR